MHFVTHSSNERSVARVRTDITLHRSEQDLLDHTSAGPQTINGPYHPDLLDGNANLTTYRFNSGRYHRRPSTSKNIEEFVHKHVHDSGGAHECSRDGCGRITINVSGMRFETQERTLDRLPQSLLGNPETRKEFWDESRQEYFLDRHRPSFQAILFFYQSGGKLRRPMEVPPDVFLSELKFYGFSEATVNNYLLSEGYTEEKSPALPDNRYQRMIWETFEFPTSSICAKIMSVINILMIALSITSFCTETLPSMEEKYGCKEITSNNTNNTEYVSKAQSLGNPFFIIETVTVAWFTVEYILRLITSPKKRSFFLDFLNTVDLLAILPYFVLLIVMNCMANVPNQCQVERSTSMLAMLRSIRVVRVFKLAKHFAGLRVLVQTIKASLNEFALFIMSFILGVILFSSIMWSVEYDENSEMFASIPDTFWYTVITMTTVGYGDKYPMTIVGKIVGAFCVISGVLVIALPVPVIVANFTTYYYMATGKHSAKLM